MPNINSSRKVSKKDVKDHYRKFEVKEAITEFCHYEGSSKAGNYDSHGWYSKTSKGRRLFNIAEPADYNKIVSNVDRVLYGTLNYYDKSVFENYESDKSKSPGGFNETTHYMLSVDIDLTGDHSVKDTESCQSLVKAGEFIYKKISELTGGKVLLLFSGNGIYLHLHPEFARFESGDFNKHESYSDLTKAFNLLLHRLEKELYDEHPELKEIVKIDAINNQKRLFKLPLSLHKKFDHVVYPIDPNDGFSIPIKEIPLSKEDIGDAEIIMNRFFDNKPLQEDKKILIKNLKLYLEEIKTNKRDFKNIELKLPEEAIPLEIIRSEGICKTIFAKESWPKGNTRRVAFMATVLKCCGWKPDDIQYFISDMASSWGVNAVEHVIRSWIENPMFPPSVETIYSNGPGYPSMNFGDVVEKLPKKPIYPHVLSEIHRLAKDGGIELGPAVSYYEKSGASNSNEEIKFNERPVKITKSGFRLFFKEAGECEIWLEEVIEGKTHYYHWVKIGSGHEKMLNRQISFPKGLEKRHKTNENELKKIVSKYIDQRELKSLFEKAGIFLHKERYKIEELASKIQEENDNADMELEITDEEKEELKNILQKPNLLEYIDNAMYERTGDKIVGEYESKHILNLNCIGARFGIASINTIKGNSSVGKTTIANVVTGLHNTKKLGVMSPTAIKYSADHEKYDVLYLQEKTDREFANKEIRLLSGDDGGFKFEVTVKNPKTGKFEVQNSKVPAKTVVTTTTAMALDHEFATRSFVLTVDDSEEQTKKIVRENFNSTKMKIMELEGSSKLDEKYGKLKKALTLLNHYEVLIPYEDVLNNLFPTGNVRSRRDSKKLINLIKECALMFQEQRFKGEINGVKVLVASWADLAYAMKLGGSILEATFTGMDKRLLKALPLIIEIIEEEGFITTNKLAAEMGISTKYSWEILSFFEKKGFIYRDEELKDRKSLSGRTIAYVKNPNTKFENLILQIRNIDWDLIKNKELEFVEAKFSCTYFPPEKIFLPPKIEGDDDIADIENKIFSPIKYQGYGIRVKEEGKGVLVELKAEENLISDKGITDLETDQKIKGAK